MQQPLQRLLLLQVAQARRVGRRNVDGEVVGDAGEAGGTPGVVGGEIGTVLVGADVDAERRRHAHAVQPAIHFVVAGIVEAHAVDDTLGAADAEQPRLRIARLRAWRDGAHFDQPEAHQRQRPRHLAILVEAGRHADRIFELEAGEQRLQFRRIGIGLLRREPEAQRVDSGAMRGLGVHLQQAVAGEAREQRHPEQRRKRRQDHAIQSGSARAPSAATETVTCRPMAAVPSGP